MENLTNTLAKGIVFPLQLVGGAVVVSTYEALIKSSILTTIYWAMGTFPFIPTFGSRTYELMGEQNALIVRGLVKRFLIDAISLNEPRITLLAMTIDMPQVNSLHIILNYRINTTNVVKTLNLDTNL